VDSQDTQINNGCHHHPVEVKVNIIRRLIDQFLSFQVQKEKCQKYKKVSEYPVNDFQNNTI
jgi:hypothetical protein